MSDVYLTLLKNSSMKFHEDTTLTIITHLPKTIYRHVDWEVGMVDIQYHHNWYYVPTNCL